MGKMKKIKVFTGSRSKIQGFFDEWVEQNPKVEIIDIVGGGLSQHGYVVCYITYQEGIQL